MVGDGVIAESYASFKITWNNPGAGEQPIWDQTAQYIELHTTDLYPDLDYKQASALATYYKYSSAEKLISLLKDINSIIDSKLIGAKPTNETLALPAGSETSSNLPAVSQKPGLPATISDKSQDEPESPNWEDEVVNDEPKKDEPKESGEPREYTVTVIADRVRLIDVQSQRGSGVTISYRMSNNMIKVVGDETVDNSSKIKALVKLPGLLGETIELGLREFETEEGSNLLVQVIPSIELTFIPGDNTVVPSGKEQEDEDWLIKALKDLKGSGAKEREFIEVRDEIRKESEAKPASSPK